MTRRGQTPPCHVDRPIFTENETNVVRLYGGARAGRVFKDAFHDFVVHGDASAVNSANEGTKAGLLHRLDVPAYGERTIELRLTNRMLDAPFADFGVTFDERRTEADAFYAALQSRVDEPDARNVQRQAFAGMIWSKQFFYFDVPERSGSQAILRNRCRRWNANVGAIASGRTSTTPT
jgi:hypothetical protein